MKYKLHLTTDEGVLVSQWVVVDHNAILSDAKVEQILDDKLSLIRELDVYQEE